MKKLKEWEPGGQNPLSFQNTPNAGADLWAQFSRAS